MQRMERSEINLFRKGLKAIPADVLSASGTTVVSLDVNEIDQVSDEISNLADTLEEFSVGGNLLKSLPDGLAKCRFLKVLLLPGNQLSSLPDSLSSLEQLEILNLSHNKLETLPDSYASMVRLRRLTLTENNLKHFPECLSSMASLEFLDVSGNPNMCKLPASLDELTHIIRFNASACGLSEWPTGLSSGLQSLKHLFLGINRIQTLPEDFDLLSGVVELDISYNDFATLPSALERMASRLRLLHCSGNPIQLIPSLKETFKGYHNDESNLPDEILAVGKAKLYLGPISASHNVHFLRHERVGHIVSVIKDRKPVHESEFKYLWIQEDDVNAADLRQYFERAIEFINSGLLAQDSGGVLVHWYARCSPCSSSRFFSAVSYWSGSSRAGVSRSATIVVAFLMYHKKIGMNAALRHVQERRRVISPNTGFMTQLHQYETELVASGHLHPSAAGSEPIPEGLRIRNPLDQLSSSSSFFGNSTEDQKSQSWCTLV